MIDSIVAKRYAKSFLLVSAAKGIVEEVEDQLLQIKAAYRSDSKIESFMTHPRIPQKAKVAAVKRIFEGKVHKMTEAFLLLLVQRRRFNLISEIADAFDTMADAYRGVVRVQVRTFAPLQDAQRSALESQVSRLVKGSKIDLQVEVDRSLMGGLWVKIGDTLLDGSVATKLKSLRERLFDMRIA